MGSWEDIYLISYITVKAFICRMHPPLRPASPRSFRIDFACSTCLFRIFLYPTRNCYLAAGVRVGPRNAIRSRHNRTRNRGVALSPYNRPPVFFLYLTGDARHRSASEAVVAAPQRNMYGPARPRYSGVRQGARPLRPSLFTTISTGVTSS